MNLLAEKYLSQIEGIIPDLAGCIDDGDPDENALRDSIYDYACDYIYDRNKNMRRELVTLAAKEIADHFCGEEEA